MWAAMGYTKNSCAENGFIWFGLKSQNETIPYHFVIVVIDAVIIIAYSIYFLCGKSLAKF